MKTNESINNNNITITMTIYLLKLLVTKLDNY